MGPGPMSKMGPGPIIGPKSEIGPDPIFNIGPGTMSQTPRWGLLSVILPPVTIITIIIMIRDRTFETKTKMKTKTGSEAGLRPGLRLKPRPKLNPKNKINLKKSIKKKSKYHRNPTK